MRPCCWNGNYNSLFSASASSTRVRGSALAVNQEQKGISTVLLNVFVFIPSHMATIHTLVAHGMFSSYHAALTDKHLMKL